MSDALSSNEETETINTDIDDISDVSSSNEDSNINNSQTKNIITYDPDEDINDKIIKKNN